MVHGFTSKFAVNQAFNAVDRQVNDGTVSFDEGRAIERGFFRRIDDETARKMIELDPAAALEDLSDATLYDQLNDTRRRELAGIAGPRAEQTRIDAETGRVRDDREAAAAKAQAARVFATGFGAKLRQGAATAVEIGVAEADGVIGRADADRLVQTLKDDEAARSERARLGDIARVAIVSGKG